MKQIYKIKIEPLTAVHIGTGEKLLPLDYTLASPNSSETKRYVKFSSDKIIDSILKSGTSRQKQELQTASESNNINDLCQFFQKYFYLGIDYDGIITKDFANLFSKKIKDGLFSNSLEVSQILHYGKDSYIPGSSIKGAIRTAILNKSLLKDLPQDIYEDLKKMANNERQKDFKKAGRYEGKIQNRALEMLPVKDIDNAKLDPFRCVEIADCNFSSKSLLVGCMENVKIDRFTKKLCSESMQIISESIPGRLAENKISSDFVIRINEDLQNIELNNGFCINLQISLKEIISACNFFFKKQFNEEYSKFYKNAYDKVDKILELKEIIDSISENSENEFLLRVGRWSQIEYVIFGNDFRNPKTPSKKGKIMPYGTSRTVLNYNGQYLPMGWCKCSVEEQM